MSHFKLLQAFVALSSLNQVNALCYFPDGDTIPLQDTPCRSDENSTCCGQGYACMSNGLCKYVHDADLYKNPWVRGSCSDKEWNNPNCPNVCVSPSNGDNTKGGMSLIECDNFPNRYFCINDDIQKLLASGLPRSSICASPGYFVEFAGTPTTVTIIGVATSSSVAASSSLATTSSTVTTSDVSLQIASPTGSQTSLPATPTAAVHPIKDKDYTVPIAAGVAVPLGVIAISVAAYLFWRSRKSKSQVGHATAPPQDLPVSETKPHLPPYGVSSMHPSPMHSPPAVYQEHPHWTASPELPGNHENDGHK